MSDFLQLLKELGPDVIRLMDDPNTERIQSKYVRSSGVLAIDYASGIGGLPKHRIAEFYGPESSGKTTLCLMACAEATKHKRYVAYIDFEHAMDLSYARALGVNMNFFSLSQPSTAEEAGDIMIKAARAKDCAIVVLDSIAQLQTEQEVESDLNSANIASVARFMKNLVKKLPPICSVNQTLILLVNQQRERPGVLFGSPIYQPGGRAYKHACSMRIELSKKTTNKEGNVAISNTTKAKFAKNKLSAPFTECEFDIIFAKGVDNAATSLQLGEALKIITKRGTTYSFKDKVLGVGIKKAKAAIESDKKLYKAIRQEILGNGIKKKENKPKVEKILPTKVELDTETSTNKVSSVLIDV